MPDWVRIKAEYVRGGISYRTLAEKHGVSPTTLFKHAKKEKWADLREQKEKIRDTKIVESAAEQDANQGKSIQTIADLLLEKIEKGIKDGSLTVDISTIRQITGSLKDLRDIKGYKTELDMQEQMARIDKLRKEAQTETSDSTIKVVIEGDLDDYAK